MHILHGRINQPKKLERVRYRLAPVAPCYAYLPLAKLDFMKKSVNRIACNCRYSSSDYISTLFSDGLLAVSDALVLACSSPLDVVLNAFWFKFIKLENRGAFNKSLDQSYP